MISNSVERSTAPSTCYLQHDGVLEFEIAALPALKHGQIFQDYDQGIPNLERLVRNSRLLCPCAYTALHQSILLIRKSSLHSAGFGTYIVTTLTLSPSTSVAICAWKTAPFHCARTK